MASVQELYTRQSESADRNFALLGLTLGIVLVILYLLKSPNPYLLGVGIIAIISGIVYLKTRKLQPQAIDLPNFYNTRMVIVSNIIFFIITGFCVYLSTTSQYMRPLFFFVLLSIAFTLIGLEIIFIKNFDKWHEIVLLTKIILASFVLRYSIYFQYPSIIGVDAWFHREYIQIFVALGYIPNFNEYLQPYYFHFPMMHLNVALLQIVSPVGDLKTAMFSSMGIGLIISTLFVYLLGKKLFGQNIGLLSILLINFSDFHILWGTQIIATTLGIILFTAILYLIHNKDLSDIRIKIILFIFLITTVFTHTISSFAVLILLVIVMTIQILLKSILGRETSNNKLKIILIVCFGLIMVNYWSYTDYMSQGQSFFKYSVHAIINMIEHADFLSRPMDTPSEVSSIGMISSLLNIGGFLVLLYFTVIGFFASIRENLNALKMGLLTLILFTFIFGFPLLGVRTIIPTRWFVFLYIPMIIVASYGIVKQFGFIHKSNIKCLIVIVVFLSFCLLMITSNLINLDLPLYNKDITYRYAYTDRELVIAEWTDRAYVGRIVTDYYYGLTVFNIGWHRNEVSSNLDDHSEGIVIWREYMRNNPVIVLVQGEGVNFKEYRIIGDIYTTQEKRDEIYTNGDCVAIKAV